MRLSSHPTGDYDKDGMSEEEYAMSPETCVQDLAGLRAAGEAATVLAVFILAVLSVVLIAKRDTAKF